MKALRRFQLSLLFALLSVVGVAKGQSTPTATQPTSQLANGTQPAAPVAFSAETPAQRSQREARSKDLTERISALLNQPDAARAFWGIDVVSLSSGQPLYEQNADKFFTPASNKKLFTTATALALLGTDYRYRTTVESAGPLDQRGELHGDLKLVGRGDPNLSGRVLPYLQKTQRKTPHLMLLEQLADQVAQRGVKQIDGDVVGDDSFFAFERYPDGWSQDDLMWDYGAGVSALTVNDNVVFFSVFPGTGIGEKARIQFDPDVPYYEVNNLVTTTAAASGPRKISMDRQPGSRLITVWGTIPMDDTAPSDALAIEDPAAFAAAAFRAMLQQRGIVIKGKDRVAHAYLSDLPPPVVDAAKSDAPITSPGGGLEPGVQIKAAATTSEPPKLILAEHDSSPIIDDIQVINKVSQNLHAEITLRIVGREKGTAPTLEAALEVEKSLLAQAGILPEEFAFFDGSGLSRQDLVTPHAVIKLLQFADLQSQSWGGAFKSTLPIAGVDGSLSDRFKGTAAQGRVQAKTGSFSHVNSLSGYAETLAGDRVAFSIFCNNHKLTGRGALKVIDQIVQFIVQDAPTASQRPQ